MTLDLLISVLLFQVEDLSQQAQVAAAEKFRSGGSNGQLSTRSAASKDDGAEVEEVRVQGKRS